MEDARDVEKEFLGREEVFPSTLKSPGGNRAPSTARRPGRGPGARVAACQRRPRQQRLELRVPQALRSEGVLERLFGEEWRRMKIVANALGERAVLKLM